MSFLHNKCKNYPYSGQLVSGKDLHHLIDKK